MKPLIEGCVKKALLSYCKGTPAKIPWPHRVLHDAVRRIEELESEIAAAREELENTRRLFDGDYDINGWLDNRENEKRLKKVIEEQSAALSLIDYVCVEPNEMQLSGYDVHRNEDAVVDRVKNRMAELARAREALIFEWAKSAEGCWLGNVVNVRHEAAARYKREIE